MSRDRYLISVADRCGVYLEREKTTFYETLSAVATLRKEHPHSAIQVTNVERCDYDSDGLTDDQRDRLGEVL